MSSDEGIFAFVLMPFSEEFDDLYKFGIKEPAAGIDVLAERVDEQIYAESILERIYRQIDVADIVIADMSGQNPNVFYEVGYAHAKDKLCILMTSDAQKLPFTARRTHDHGRHDRSQRKWHTSGYPPMHHPRQHISRHSGCARSPIQERHYG